MKTRPERPFAPALPWKSQVAYAVVIEPPSEWPPMTTVRPCFFARLTTLRVSWTATFMPQFLANSVSAVVFGVKCGEIEESVSQPR